MSATEQDELLAALARLPAPTQHAIARNATLTRTLRALSSDREARTNDDGELRPRRAFLRGWLARERLLPAVLCLAGVLYVRGAVQQLVLLFGSRPASATQTAAAREALPVHPKVVSLREAGPS
jgi:hypothetical protein